MLGEILADTTKRRRALAGLLVVLTLAVAAAVAGQFANLAPMTVVGVAMLAGVIALLAKVLTAAILDERGTSRGLKALSERTDETENWLELFDQDTRSSFAAVAQRLEKLDKRLEGIGDDLARLNKAAASREQVDEARKAAEEVRSSADKLQQTQAKSGKKIDETVAEVRDVARRLAELHEASDRLEAAIGEAESGMDEKLSKEAERLAGEITSARDEQDRLRRSGLQAIKKEALEEFGASTGEIGEKLEGLAKRTSATASYTGRLRGDGYAQFGRVLTSEFERAVREETGPKLGLKIEAGELRYLERKIQQIEGLCEGRMATTSEDAVARVLAARAVQTDQLRILEIGVLFGVASIFMHTALAPFFDDVKLVLLDPFDGYYGGGHLDPLTGQRVTRAAVERNLRRAAIATESVTIVEKFSTDDGALELAQAEGPFDVVVIDGDHSYEGIKADFERYSGLLAGGGVLIVDDYGSDEWPDVERYVDAVVRKDRRFERLGSLSRTAIFRRRGSAGRKRASGARAAMAKGSSVARDNGQPASAKTESKPAAAKQTKQPAAKKSASQAAPTRKTAGRKKPASKKKSGAKRSTKSLAKEIVGERDPPEIKVRVKSGARPKKKAKAAPKKASKKSAQSKKPPKRKKASKKKAVRSAR